AFLDGKAIRVSSVSALEGAIVSTGNLKTLAASPAWARFGGLIGGINRIRGYGDFVHYHLLARGALDVVIESDVNILDIAALTVIIAEAGGRLTDLSGATGKLASASRCAAVHRWCLRPPPCSRPMARCMRRCWRKSASGADPCPYSCAG